MSGEIRFPVVGNLTSDPTLNYTSNGTPVVNFTIASTAREFDRKAGQMAQGETVYMKCTAWRELAENLVATLNRGMRVVAFGRLHQRKYRPEGGDLERTVMELEVEAIGPELRWATAQVTKVTAARPAGGSPWEPAEPTPGWDDEPGPF